MNTDFLDAHERHWMDAELLLADQRWANADHLYGMAAECGLKRLMLAFGMPLDSAGERPENRSDQVHANGVWVRFESYRYGHPRGAGFGLPAGEPFSDWCVSQRYAHQSHFDALRVIAHQRGARLVRQLVRKATLEGLI